MEPLSAFSLSLAILNIFLNTTNTAVKRASQFKNYEKEATRWKQAVESCQTSLEGWKRLFYHDHVMRLIPEDWGEIEERYLAATEASFSVYKTLMGKVVLKRDKWIPFLRNPDKTALANWAAWISSKVSHLRSGDPVHAVQGISLDVLQRFIGVLYQNDLLETEIKNLQTATADLHSFTRSILDAHGHPASGSESELRTRDDARRIRRAAQQLLDSYLANMKDGHTDQWTLGVYQLDKLDGEAFQHLVHDHTLTFLVKSAASYTEVHATSLPRGTLAESPLPDAMRLIMDLNMPPKVSVGLGETGEFLTLRRGEEVQTFTKSWRCILQEISNLEYPNKTPALQALALERYRMAFGCVIWLMLLWGSDWFNTLCTCSLRSIRLRPKPSPLAPSADSVDDYQSMGYHHMFRSHPRDPKSHKCPRISSAQNQMLLLGVFLAEIFLGELIDIEVENQEIQEELVDRVNRHYGVGRYKMSTMVRFCFQKGTSQDWVPVSYLMRAEHIKEMQTSLLVPLKELCEAAQKSYVGTVRENFQQLFQRFVEVEPGYDETLEHPILESRTRALLRWKRHYGRMSIERLREEQEDLRDHEGMMESAWKKEQEDLTYRRMALNSIVAEWEAASEQPQEAEGDEDIYNA